jgi:uncharacterized protein YecE (DUF72 family)
MSGNPSSSDRTYAQRSLLDLDRYGFRGFHPNVYLGTASDRYSGWLGQIYTSERYAGRITKRTHKVGGKSFVEAVLPLDSVAEYFEHFRVLELDFTFYRPLLDAAGKPTQTYRLLQQYHQFLQPDDRIVLKVPQQISAQKLYRAGEYLTNPDYLQPLLFTRRFYQPAVELFGPSLAAMVFEQEYQRQGERADVAKFAAQLDRFFRAVPADQRYHVELRTESHLAEPVFEVFSKHGLGQVLSHWTWLPGLAHQFARSGGRFLNRAQQCLVRLMTPRGVRYEEAYARAYPFDRMVDGMQDPLMVEETVHLMHTAIQEKTQIQVIVNNRAGGNAPDIARQIAERFVESQATSAGHRPTGI